MSSADRGNPAAEAEMLAALSRLARKGAYALPMEAEVSDGGRYAVFSPRNGFARSVGTIPGRSVVLARRLGWLEVGQDGAQLRLAAAGLRALRRARSGEGATHLCSDSKRQPRMAARRSIAPAGGVHEGPLAWLRRRKDKGGRPLISEAQFAAGERLRVDFWRGQLMPRVTANWSGSVTSRRQRRAAPGVGLELGDAAVAARERVNRAFAAVGPELAGILVDVCCHEMGLEAAGRAQAWPERASKVVLQLALTRLARHYGLIAPEPPLSARRLRHWGEEGYRPNLDAWR
jgi:uncharacterized protein DUF6456